MRLRSPAVAVHGTSDRWLRYLRYLHAHLCVLYGYYDHGEDEEHDGADFGQREVFRLEQHCAERRFLRNI